LIRAVINLGLANPGLRFSVGGSVKWIKKLGEYVRSMIGRSGTWDVVWIIVAIIWGVWVIISRITTKVPRVIGVLRGVGWFTARWICSSHAFTAQLRVLQGFTIVGGFIVIPNFGKTMLVQDFL
jgi:hypothetical protein